VHLHNLDVWIIDALRETPHPSHFTLQEALDHVALLKPNLAILTNLHTDLDYSTLAARLPEGVIPAYDGMQFTSDIRSGAVVHEQTGAAG
jgi:phosphoribosyl 1,2-cyclic phosphate phosphodiesterase